MVSSSRIHRFEDIMEDICVLVEEAERIAYEASTAIGDSACSNWVNGIKACIDAGATAVSMEDTLERIKNREE